MSPKKRMTLFWSLLLSGVALRIVACALSRGTVHPDEHQQYLEVAQGIVHGNSVQWWEYQVGTRHYLYPGILAGLLFALEVVGVRDPILQASVIRALISIAVLSAAAMIAWELMRRREGPAGVLFLSLCALSPDLIYMTVRTLSESAMMVPLLMGVYYLARRPVIAGICFGVMFAIRLQSAPLIAGFLGFSVYQDAWVKGDTRWSGRTSLGLCCGLAWSIALVGLIDRLTWGHWFHSTIQCVSTNVLENKAAEYGTAPWPYYLETSTAVLFHISPLMLVLPVVGWRRAPAVALATVLFAAAHSAIGHKEERFIWPELPLVFLLTAHGLQDVFSRFANPSGNVARALVVALTFAYGVPLRLERIEWNHEPSRSSSEALAKVGRLRDLTGVAVIGVPESECGNYFYLRKDVPLLIQSEPNLEAFRSNGDWQSGKINYIIIHRLVNDTYQFHELHLEEIGRVRFLSIYRISTRTGEKVGMSPTPDPGQSRPGGDACKFSSRGSGGCC
jgi:phosphatidylinositol glycan class B